MKYNGNNPIHNKQALSYLKKLQEKGAQYEITEKRHPRTLKQNKYLHACIALFAINFGYTLTEAKTLLKRNCSFMIYEKNGQRFLKETSKMNTLEIAEFIEWIRNYSNNQGYYILSADEYKEHYHEVEREIELNKQFLTA